MLISACYQAPPPEISEQKVRMKQISFTNVSQPKRAEVRKLPLQTVCCLASISTPPLQDRTFFPLHHNLPAEIFHSLLIIIPSNERLSFTHLFFCLDRPNDGHLGALFNVKSKFGHNHLSQRGLNYTLLMYINDIFPVLFSFWTTAWHWGCMQHSESQHPCPESQHVSHSHTVFESFSQRKLPTLLNPFIIRVNATLVCWSLSSVTLNFPKKTH